MPVKLIKYYKQLPSLIFYSILLGLFWTVIIQLLLPKNFSKYSLELHSTRTYAKNSEEFLLNVGAQNETKYVVLWENVNGEAALKVRTPELFSEFQYNIPYKHTKQKQPFVENLNQKPGKEICFFTQRNDSVFINIFDYEAHKFLYLGLYVDTIGGINAKYDFSFVWHGTQTINNTKILLWSLKGGFALYPRKIYSLNINTGIVKSTQNFGMKPEYVIIDSINNLTWAGSFASSNCPDSYPYSYNDSMCYAFVIGKNLKLKNAPITFPGAPSNVVPLNYMIDNKLLYFYASQAVKDTCSHFFLLDTLGNFTPYYALDSLRVYLNSPKVYSHNYPFIILRSSSKHYAFNINDKKLEQNRITELFENNIYVGSFDLNQNGQKQHIFSSYDNGEIIIYQSNFKNPVKHRLENCGLGWHVQSVSVNRNKNVEIFLKSEQNYFLLEYKKNPYHWISYLQFIGFWIIITLFFIGLLTFQKKRIEKRYQIQQKLQTLQLQNYRNQLDPHFTFNAMTSIGSYIIKEEKLKAYDLFTKFSRLTAQVLDGSNEIYTTLESELAFTKDYLDFQQVRFKKLFDFDIKIDDNTKQRVMIPKMMIQGAAENAIRHGFHKREKGGLINIEVYQNENKLTITVTDNGIGRQAAQKAKTGNRGKGTEVLKEQIAFLKKYHNYNLSYEILDLLDGDNKPKGTRVVYTVFFRIL